MFELPIPGPQWSQIWQRRFQQVLEIELVRKVEKQTDIDTNRFILTSPNGTRYAITVDDAGVVGSTPV